MEPLHTQPWSNELKLPGLELERTYYVPQGIHVLEVQHFRRLEKGTLASLTRCRAARICFSSVSGKSFRKLERGKTWLEWARRFISSGDETGCFELFTSQCVRSRAVYSGIASRSGVICSVCLFTSTNCQTRGWPDDGVKQGAAVIPCLNPQSLSSKLYGCYYTGSNLQTRILLTPNVKPGIYWGIDEM